MEYLVYANMVAANSGEAIDTECYLLQLKFNFKQSFKSAWLNFASIGVLLLILAQSQIASADFVNTNGSCLNVRTGPGLEYPVIDCVSNGSSILPVVNYANGFARLSSGNWVSDQWIGTTPGYGYSPSGYGYGVGGEYPEYFTHHHHHGRWRRHWRSDYGDSHYPTHWRRHWHSDHRDSHYATHWRRHWSSNYGDSHYRTYGRSY